MTSKLSAARRPAMIAALGVVVLLAGLSGPGAPSAGAQIKPGSASGGPAVAHRAGGKRVSTSNVPKALYHRIEHKAGEPTIGATKDGKLFYAAIDTNTRVDIMRSNDDGETWEIASPKIGSRNAQVVTLDPYVYVDEDTNRVFTIDLYVACSYLSFTDDRGKSWTTNPLACGRPVNDHQTLFSGPPVVSPTATHENIVYYCWNDIASSSCSKSLDGGFTFHPTGSPAFAGYYTGDEGQDPGFCGGLHGHGVVGPDGTVYLPREYCDEPWLAMSHDEGRTWEAVRVAENGHPSGSDPSVAVDDKGNIYYAWVADDRLPYLTVSRDGGKSWSKPLMVGAPGLKEANLPTLDVGAPGKVAIAYMGATNSPFPRCERECQTSDYAETTWNGYITMSADVFGRNPLFYSGSVNDPKDPMYRGRCGPGRCGAIYDFIDVIVAPNGQPYGAYVDACTMICPQGGANDSAEGVVGRLVGGPKLR